MRRDRRQAEREMRDKERGSGTRVKSESGGKEKERTREFYLAPKGREESAHAGAGPVGELCRVSRLKVGQRTNQLSKAARGIS